MIMMKGDSDPCDFRLTVKMITRKRANRDDLVHEGAKTDDLWFVSFLRTDSQPDLLPNHTLRFLAGDTLKPYSAHAIRLMTKMREVGVQGFIGPDELCSAEALVAAAWNSPMITYVSVAILNRVRVEGPRGIQSA
jgi:hypothetical protein